MDQKILENPDSFIDLDTQFRNGLEKKRWGILIAIFFYTLIIYKSKIIVFKDSRIKRLGLHMGQS